MHFEPDILDPEACCYSTGRPKAPRIEMALFRKVGKGLRVQQSYLSAYDSIAPPILAKDLSAQRQEEEVVFDASGGKVTTGRFHNLPVQSGQRRQMHVLQNALARLPLTHCTSTQSPSFISASHPASC